MSDKFGVSIIIPCYNDARYLREAVESVYAQSLSMPFEILIVDDGSTDEDSLRIIDAVAAEHPEITVHHHDHNSGVASARNTGLRAAQYDYIFPLDVDNKLATDPEVILHGGYIDKSVKLLMADPDIAMVHCSGKAFDAVDGAWLKNAYDERIILFINMIDTHAMYRREEALSIGGYDEQLRYANDWNFAVAMINSRYKAGRAANISTIADPLFLYRIRSDGSNLTKSPDYTSQRDLIRANIARSPELYAKHFPKMSEMGIEVFLDTLMAERKGNDRRFLITEGAKMAFKPASWGRLSSSIGYES